MQSAYRPTLALVFIGNETRPSAVGLDVRFWFQAMTFMLDCFLGSNCRRMSHHTACITASRTVKESRYCKRLCSRRSELHQQPSIRERPHADEAFTLMNTSVGALLNELVRSLGKADLRNAHQIWRPACNGQEEESELAHCRVNVEGGNKSHGNDGSDNRQHTHN